MNEDQGFIDAIIADPDDDDLRLIYADWLEEQENVARAEFIRFQVSEEPDNELVQRTRLPVPQGSPFVSVMWQSESSVYLVWSRGFIEEITCTADDWLAHASTITREHPVQKVKLTTWPKLRLSADADLSTVPIGNCWTTIKEKSISYDAWLASRDHTIGALRSDWPRIEFELPS